MKTEDLIREYMKDHKKADGDSERDKRQPVAKPVKPVTRKGK